MAFWDREKGGMRCEAIDENGETHHCVVFKNSKGEKLASGTDVTVNVSKQNDCNPIIMGNYDIVDGDEDRIQQIIDQKVKACKRGIAGA